MQINVDGRTAYAYTGGKAFDPALPCVVFIHGALHDHSVWTLLARWAANHGHSVLAVDQPGHGRMEQVAAQPGDRRVGDVLGSDVAGAVHDGCAHWLSPHCLDFRC